MKSAMQNAICDNILHRSYLSSLAILFLSLILIPASSFDLFADSPLVISEFLADGNRSFADEDGEFPDWIEIFNIGNQTINLNGWHLSNDPANLEQWTFPSINLAVGKYLVVFASGKNRSNPGAPLHTNFRLATEGEYLALVQPDGKTVAHEYNPYPNQKTPKKGYSFGLRMDVQSFAQDGSAVKYLVPTQDISSTQWTSPSFDDSTWTAGTMAVGYGTSLGKFTVTLYEATITVSNLATADSVIANRNLQKRVVTELTDVINFLDNQEDGHFADSPPFPGHTFNVDVDNFVVMATGVIIIPSSGIWTFGINSDDGARLRIDGKNVIVDDTAHAPQDRFASIDLSAGSHSIELVFFEQGGGAELELFAARGQYSAFDANRFRLVGDRQGGGLALEGFGSLIKTNVQETMKGRNSSIFLRIPFQVDDPLLNYNLTFRIKYNDGFIAYLNGQELIRRNAPTPALWNSTALQKRSLAESMTTEEMVVNKSAPILKKGTNILAIQGLANSPNDEDFLFQTELIGTAILPDSQRYLNPPTPGSQNGSGVQGFLEEVTFSQKHGFYNEPFSLTLSTTTKGDIIRFTTDGTEPSETNGTTYSSPIRIEKTTPLRARVVKSDYEPGNIKTQTYLFLDDILQQKQPANYPKTWGGGVSADYEVDPDVVNDSRYRNTIRDDLKSLPVLSFVTDPKNLFDSRTGIYTHPESKGVAWERPVSTELIFPHGEKEGFQINNGLRIQGGYGRSPGMRKHSFRMLFKSEYGPPTLRYKVFDNSSVDKFDQLVLRSGYNYTWHGGETGFNSNVGRADYLRDEYSRRLELAIGKAASHGRFVHLYLNGLYWGVYNLCERPDDSFAAEYFGGEKEEYDVITSGTKGIGTTQIKAGDKEAWNAMMNLVRAGGFQDPKKYEALKQYVDIDALIDYMLVIYFTGNRDAPTVIGGGGTPWNFYSNHRRIPGGVFRFFCWDSEWTLEEPNRNVVTFHTQGYDDPSFIFLKLKTNTDFLTRVADRIQKHFFNGGGLTPESTIAIYSGLAKQMDRAIVGESARWGDVQSSRPKTRDDNWLPEINRILTTYLPVRTGIVLDQLRKSGFYPTVPAPVFSQHGGPIQYGAELSMALQENIQQDIVTTPLIKIDHTWKYDQTGTISGSGWIGTEYNDSNWPSGKALLYVENADLAAPKNTPLIIGKITYYFRSTFDVADSLDLSKATLQLSPFVDDGMIAYLNGQELFRIGMPEGPVDSTVFANRTVSDAVFEGPFTLPASLLKKGKNVIAVEVHQVNASSSDFVFGMTLNLQTPVPDTTPSNVPIYYTVDGSDPRLPGGEINTKSALAYNGTLKVNGNMTVKARSLINGQWSALNEVSFLIESAPASVATIQANLRITELMYNPPDGEQFEFVELHNTHPTSSLSLGGTGFTNGIQVVIPNGIQIPAKGYLLVVPSTTAAEQAAFRSHYGLSNTIPLVGPYSGKLANSGEQIDFSALQTGVKLISFAYNDGRGWPKAADGAGHSLVPVLSAIDTQTSGSLNYGLNWRMSYAIGGSPGKADPEPAPSVILNELFANARSGETDWIELYNSSSSPIHLGGWFLSDNLSNLARWPLPSVEIPAGAWLTFDEVNDFNNPVDSGFALSKDGESLFLSYLPGQSGINRVVDAVTFKAQDSDRAYGRFTESSPFFVATKTSTRGTANDPAKGTLTIDEMMVQPDASDAGDNVTFEYIEILNASNETREFQNTDGVFRIDGGVQFEFPPNIQLSAKGRLVVVGFDPSDTGKLSAFKNRYGLSGTEVRILGPYTGKLSNRGERLALEKPKGVDASTQDTIWGIVDEVIYFTQSPWTQEASGTGKSLQRLDPDRPGSEPANWRADLPTLGTKPTFVNSWMLY